MNELTLTNQSPATITIDKEKAIREVKANLTPYYDEQGKFIPLDESKLPESKKELATLRKVSKAFNDKKIAVKKELSAEILQFESDVKEVIKVVKDAELEFDTQIKASESRINVARQHEIMNWQEFENISRYVEFQSDWLKKSWTDEKLKVELNNIAADIDKDISTIKMLATSHNLETDKYVEMYKTTQLANIQQRIIEDMALVAKVTKVEIVRTVKIDPNADIHTINKSLTGTIQALQMVKEYCKTIGVKWEDVK